MDPSLINNQEEYDPSEPFHGWVNWATWTVPMLLWDAYWKITEDTIWQPEDDYPSRVGTEGPYGCNDKLPTTIRFRMYGDDGPEDGCYYGEAANDNSLEYALDGFGTPDAGCTMIDILMDGRWEPYIS